MTEMLMTAKDLLSASAVRGRCNEIFTQAIAGRLKHFCYIPERMPVVVDYVSGVMRELYPTGNIPYHSRLRHFNVGGIDRIANIKRCFESLNAKERLNSWADLIIVSVFMDAGAGPTWRYTQNGRYYHRSEGLAVAILDLFMQGWFSADPISSPWRVQGERLLSITHEEFLDALQVSSDNMLIGCEGRVSLLNSLGRVILTNPLVFDRRLGTMVIPPLARTQALQASDILTHVLSVCNPIWPGRITMDDTNLGDTWRHSLVGVGPTCGLVPFHKLSQWLTYSLIELLEQEDYVVEGIDELTGLAEYRNGGLMLDLGVLALKDPQDELRSHDVGSELVVEWRAMTVILLDLVAEGLREKFGLTKRDFPLAKALEGGTWHAGRRIAKEKRPDAGPPLLITSDGTVF